MEKNRGKTPITVLTLLTLQALLLLPKNTGVHGGSANFISASQNDRMLMLYVICWQRRNKRVEALEERPASGASEGPVEG